MRGLAVQLARRGLKRFGLELRQAEALAPVTPLERPDLALYARGDVAFEVPLRKCASFYHFSYGPAGWHPFVETLRQYRRDPALRYETSLLHDFYQRYRPATVLEVFLGHLPEAESFGSSLLAALDMPRYAPFFPWDAELRLRRPLGAGGLAAAEGHQGFGPVSAAKGRLEFRRLTETYEAIKAQGYRPRLGRDGDIRGYFLKAGDDYRFLVRQGLHRTPALAALGCETIRVKFFPPLPRAIFLADLENWPQVRCGLVSAELAERIFRLFFENGGKRKAERLGLLPPPGGSL